MKQLFILAPILVLGFVHCGFKSLKSNSSPNGGAVPVNAAEILARPANFADVNQYVFGASCQHCHSSAVAAGGIVLESYASIRQNLTVVLGAIESGAMPPSGLNSFQSQLFSKWINQGAPEMPMSGPSASPSPSPSGGIVYLPTYTSIHDHIFHDSCLGCHRVGGKAQDVPLEPYGALIAQSSVVSPKNADGSTLYTAVRDGKMPTRSSHLPHLTVEQVNAIQQWINEGAQNN